MRLLVIVGLVGSGGAAGALVGAIAALMVIPLRAVVPAGSPALVVAALVGVGLVLDLARLRAVGPVPPAVGRQVPQEWTRLLDPAVVSVLFGARLGVGPLTILSTWTWWATTLGSAWLGFGPAVMVGLFFGVVRLVVTVLVSLRAERGDQAASFVRLRSYQRIGWAGLNAVAAVAVIALVATNELSAVPPDLASPDPSSAVRPAASASNRSAAAATQRSLASTGAGTPAGQSIGDQALSEQPPSTNPAQLEDFVREPIDPTTAQVADPADLAATGSLVAPDAPSSEPAALAAALTADIDGFEAIDQPGADRYLDLRAAAAIQPDPTEEIALLETRGFQGGWTRAFLSPANDVAVASVYQFDDATQAEFYLEDGLITIGGYGGSFFDVEGLPGVRGFAQTFTEDGEELVSLGAAFQAGPRWFLVYFVGSPETVTPETLVPVIAAQRERELGSLVGG